ncbi:hypothetical protein ACJX0J_040654, partial [Zea mays]
NIEIQKINGEPSFLIIFLLSPFLSDISQQQHCMYTTVQILTRHIITLSLLALPELHMLRIKLFESVLYRFIY